MPVLGHAFSIVTTGGRAALPKVVKQVTKTLGLPPDAKESEILKYLTGHAESEMLMAELEADVDIAEINADLDRYLAELEAYTVAVTQVNETERAGYATKDTFITHARPTGLYKAFRWIQGFLIFFALTAVLTYWMQWKLLNRCLNVDDVSACIVAVRNAKDAMPLWLLVTAIATVSTMIWAAVLAPVYSYYPLRSFDKWTRGKSGASVDHGDGLQAFAEEMAKLAPSPPTPTPTPPTPTRRRPEPPDEPDREQDMPDFLDPDEKAK